ncbi:MAG: OadG family protein [Cellvibrionaceae bacterium]
MTESLISQGVDLMIYGMGTVFIFLVVLIFATTAMSYCVRRFIPEPEPTAAPQAPAAPTASGQVDGQVLKVLQAAVDAYRNKK